MAAMTRGALSVDRSARSNRRAAGRVSLQACSARRDPDPARTVETQTLGSIAPGLTGRSPFPCAVVVVRVEPFFGAVDEPVSPGEGVLRRMLPLETVAASACPVQVVEVILQIGANGLRYEVVKVKGVLTAQSPLRQEAIRTATREILSDVFAVALIAWLFRRRLRPSLEDALAPVHPATVQRSWKEALSDVA